MNQRNKVEGDGRAISGSEFYDLGQIIGELEKQVSDYPNLLAVVLSQGYADEPLSDITLEKSGPHIIVNRMIAGCIKEPIVIMWSALD